MITIKQAAYIEIKEIIIPTQANNINNNINKKIPNPELLKTNKIDKVPKKQPKETKIIFLIVFKKNNGQKCFVPACQDFSKSGKSFFLTIFEAALIMAP